MKKNEEKRTCGCSCKKKIAVLAGVVLVSVAVAFGACRLCCCGTKTMVIDLDRVQREAVVYKTIIEGQEAYAERLQAQLSVDAAQLRSDFKALEDKKSKMSEANYKKELAALQKKDSTLAQQYQLRQVQMRLATDMVVKQVQPTVNTVLETVAKKNGAGLVLYRLNQMPYISKCNDLTDAFVKALNDQVKPQPYPNPETIQPVAGGQ